MEKENIDSSKYEVLDYLSRGEYVEIKAIVEHLGLSEEIVKAHIQKLMEEGDAKKHPSEEKYAATPQRHGIYEIKSIFNPEETGYSSARLSPEDWESDKESILAFEKKFYPQKKEK